MERGHLDDAQARPFEPEDLSVRWSTLPCIEVAAGSVFGGLRAMITGVSRYHAKRPIPDRRRFVGVAE